MLTNCRQKAAGQYQIFNKGTVTGHLLSLSCNKLEKERGAEEIEMEQEKWRKGRRDVKKRTPESWRIDKAKVQFNALESQSLPRLFNVLIRRENATFHFGCQQLHH